MMDILVHVPDHLLARVDEKVQNREFATRCQFITKAVRWYLEHLSDEKAQHDLTREATLTPFCEEKPLIKET